MLAPKKQAAAARSDSEREPHPSTNSGQALLVPASAAADDYIASEIDRLVYELYGLTAEEIRIVEGA